VRLVAPAWPHRPDSEGCRGQALGLLGAASQVLRVMAHRRRRSESKVRR